MTDPRDLHDTLRAHIMERIRGAAGVEEVGTTADGSPSRAASVALQRARSVAGIPRARSGIHEGARSSSSLGRESIRPSSSAGSAVQLLRGHSRDHSGAQLLHDQRKQLLPFVRADHRMRTQVTQLFRRLEARTEVRSGTDSRESHERKERLRRKRYEAAVDNVFAPTCGLLESYWEQFRVGRDEQRRFADAKFKVPNLENFNAVSREVHKYSAKNEYLSGILSLMGVRETYLKTIVKWSCSPALLDTNNESVQESIVIELFNMILVLRHVTCMIVDAVCEYRAVEGFPVPIMREGRNYMLKMQDDLDALADSNFGTILPGYRLRGNPMLLPPCYFDPEAPPPERIYATFGFGNGARDDPSSSTAGATPSAGSGGGRGNAIGAAVMSAVLKGFPPTNSHDSPHLSLRGRHRSAAARAFTSSLRSSHRAMSPISSGPASSLSTTAGAASAGGVGGAEASRGDGAVPEDVRYEGSRLPGAKRERIITLAEGQEANTQRQPTDRELYFKKLALRQQRAANAFAHGDRPSEDSEKGKGVRGERNIYKFPKSIYAPRPRPCWMLTGEVLMRSLDPSVCILHTPYDERVEYERMQFGRISTPPVLLTPQAESVLDIETRTYRMSAPVPNYTYADLHRREMIIFGESRVMRSLSAKRKLHRGLLKLKMAYRGFTVRLREIREKRESSERTLENAARAAEGFKRWVAEFAPEWHAEVVEDLGEAAYEMLVFDGAGMDEDDDDDDDL